MKKLIFTLSAAALLASCAQERFVQQSEICVTNAVQTKIYFKNNPTGEFMYKTWQSGIYGTAKVFLVDSTEFAGLLKKSI
jgi:Prokaryotic membrane lipoprotein lipid attachment site